MDATQLIIILAALLLALGLLLYWLQHRTPTRSETERRFGANISALANAMRRAWRDGVTDGAWAEIEDALLAADLGVESAQRIVSGARRTRPKSVIEARSAVARMMREEFADVDRLLNLPSSPSVVLVVGVNGSGKTTTIAKLAKRLTDSGETIVLAAGDTFRAAAGEQLRSWGQRLGVPVVGGADGADSAGVAFDAIGRAKSLGSSVVIVDTAGRLQAKKNLMAELGKIFRVANGSDGLVDEVLLVMDASTGQNGLSQVKEFAEAVPLTGIVLTKLDGTAKGGIVVAVERSLSVPVKFVGLGEQVDDLIPFDPATFVNELLEA